MVSIVISLAVLLIGFALYSRVVEKIFGPDDRQTPAIAINDGVDCIPMKPWRSLLVQLLNIAGTGPIFGAIMGACFGPVVFLWIILGGLFGGVVHDYMSGMISSRHKGESIAELSGVYLGKGALWLMRIFSVVLLILTCTVFASSAAALIAQLTPKTMGLTFWVVVILAYYVLATILPIDKVIGRIYPVFGVLLIVMAASIFGGLIAGGYKIPDITLSNLHPDGLQVWPFMLITVACGAVSGFHATQSPMVAKCITSEKQGRMVFGGAMMIETIIALVWAAAGTAFYGATDVLTKTIASLGQSGAVYEISQGLLGTAGGILAVIGVIVCPISSGDTSLRSARLILSEMVHLDQKSFRNRLIITLPLLLIVGFLTQIDFSVLWRYSAWANQTLAMISLWVATSYLIKNSKYRFGSLVTALPAAFMTAVTMTYLLMAKEGFGLPVSIGYPAGAAFAAALFIVYAVALRRSSTVSQGQAF